MIAYVVPVTRLRRATDWWSYKIPPAATVHEGALVSIPFHGRTVLGVVWRLEKEDRHAKESINEVYFAKPLVREPHRRFIEWLADAGFCSLSTAVHFWLPAGLREYPLRPFATELLHQLEEQSFTAADVQKRSQQLVLVPGERPDISRALQKKAARFLDFFLSHSDKEELANWMRIASGSTTVAIGRERALTAPWLNLREVAVFEPEDISYFHEQIPYLDLVEAGKKLAAVFSANLSIRSHVPERAAATIWGKEVTGSTQTPASLHFVDLRRERILNPSLLTALQRALAAKKEVLILYNAKDRKALRENGIVLVPGIETLTKQLAQALGFSTLPSSIHFGTRRILDRRYPRVGLTVILSLDPLLRQTNFRDSLHGLADVMHLFSYPVPCIIQMHQSDHPLVHALRNRQLDKAADALITDQKAADMPPFAEHIVCSRADSATGKPTAAELYTKLSELRLTDWQISHPFQAIRHKVETSNILLHAPSGTRVPAALRTVLAALPRPWKVQRNPWYAE